MVSMNSKKINWIPGFVLAMALFVVWMSPVNVVAQEEPIQEETPQEGEVSDAEYNQKKANELMDKQRNKDYAEKPYLGNVMFTVSYGLYNYNSEWVNKEKQETRNYYMPIPYPMAGIDLAFRLGKDSSNPKQFYTHDEGAGFHYYRSNSGIFTDFEMGVRAYGAETNPGGYSYDVKCDGADKSGCGGKDSLTGQYVDLNPMNYYTDITDADGNTLYTIYRPLNMIPSEAKNDGLTAEQVKKSGKVGSQVFMAYLSTFYHVNLLNYLLTFGYNVNWFDASIGPSLRVAYYNEYSDPMRMERLGNDNTLTNISIVWRQYIQIFRRMRLRAHYYWPMFSAISRWTKDVQNNEEEHILNTGIDFSLSRYLFFSIGYEYHFWKVNPAADSRWNVYRKGYEMVDRTSNEIYGSVTFDIPVGGK